MNWFKNREHWLDMQFNSKMLRKIVFHRQNQRLKFFFSSHQFLSTKKMMTHISAANRLKSKDLETKMFNMSSNYRTW